MEVLTPIILIALFIALKLFGMFLLGELFNKK